jgi:hypothetical protein
VSDPNASRPYMPGYGISLNDKAFTDSPTRWEFESRRQ